MFNKAMLIGNLGKKPENVSKGELSIVKFSVATSKKTKTDTKTVWHNITVFGHSADYAMKYLDKGSKVMIEGEIDVGQYEKDGHKRNYYNINAWKVLGLDSKKQDDSNAPDPEDDLVF